MIDDYIYDHTEEYKMKNMHESGESERLMNDVDISWNTICWTDQKAIQSMYNRQYFMTGLSNCMD